jgi:hypothetical protein
MIAKLPRRERGTLVARTRLADPNMNRHALSCAM